MTTRPVIPATRRSTVVDRRSPLRLTLILAGLGLLLYAFTSGIQGFLQIRHKWQELETVKAQLDRLKAENDSLRQIVWLLENDLDYVEKVAREDYGMIKPGERVYLLRGGESQGRN